jgi:hypothetical protein
MLHMHIIMYLMDREAASSLERGVATGWSLSHFQGMYNVPKATFYRAVKYLIETKVIYKRQRNCYCLSNEFRKLCNQQKDAAKVTSDYNWKKSA